VCDAGQVGEVGRSVRAVVRDCKEQLVPGKLNPGDPEVQDSGVPGAVEAREVVVSLTPRREVVRVQQGI
jgi:hypothetical protein